MLLYFIRSLMIFKGYELVNLHSFGPVTCCAGICNDYKENLTSIQTQKGLLKLDKKKHGNFITLFPF